MELSKKSIQLFPAIEDVFEHPTAMHKAIFFPLMTIDLASIEKGRGKVHIISVYGNGDPEANYSSDKANFDFIKFKIKGDKYEFEGNLSDLPQSEKVLDWYEEAEQEYTSQKEKYFTQSEYVKIENAKREKIDFDYATYIEGVINYWVTRDKYIETNKFIQGGYYTGGYSDHERDKYIAIGEPDEDSYTYDEDSIARTCEEWNIDINSLEFIASLTAFNYISFGDDETTIFIDRQNNEVCQFSDWS